MYVNKKRIKQGKTDRHNTVKNVSHVQNQQYPSIIEDTLCGTLNIAYV